ncbi:MAG TPA: CHAT domain-containing protein [Anaerolineae bacterium]|nr:CHAT domain-containing protein [Anaerolineae bacterium]
MDDEHIRKLIDKLTRLPDTAARVGYLRAHGGYDATTLNALLAASDTLARNDPSQAQVLAHICLGLAEEMAVPIAVARAQYLQAQALALSGHYAQALPLIESARRGFLAHGQTPDAARTCVGEMHALAALGQYQEALTVGETALSLAGEAEPLLGALVAQNRGLILHRVGRYEDALAAYDTAATAFAQLGEAERLAQVENNRGVVLLSLGQGREAVAAFRRAAETFAKLGRQLLSAQAISNQGAALLQLADYRAALAAFDRARQIFDKLQGPVEIATLTLDIAQAHLALNLYPEALAGYDEALGLFAAATMPYERGQALVGKAAALIALRRRHEADQALEEAYSIFAHSGNEPWIAMVRLEQAGLQIAANRTVEAKASVEDALAICQHRQLPVGETYARLRLADLLLDEDVKASEEHLLAALDTANRLALPPLRYRAHARLGRLRLRQGRTDEAESHLRQAVEEIERLRATLVQEALRSSFLRDKITPYQDLVQLYLARSDQEGLHKAFAVAEQARSRALVDRLAGALDERLSSAKAEDTELLTRLRELRAQLDLIYNELLSDEASAEADEGARSHRIARLRSQALVGERELSRLQLWLSTRSNVPPMSAQPRSLSQVQASLENRTALLAYYMASDELLAFVITPQLSHVHRHLTSLARLRSSLARLNVQWERFRMGTDYVSRHRPWLERTARAVLAELYDQLVRPLVDELDGERLVVIPHGPLHRVPFHALFDGRHYLLEKWEVSYAPSATVYVLMQRSSRQGWQRALVVAAANGSIPRTADEANAIARLFPNAMHLQGKQATVRAVRQAAPTHTLIHLACHGLFRADNPLFSALKLADGWLTAADVTELQLNADLAVLSACETGRSGVIAGDEILGLTRAFLEAGTASLVVSLWLVNDEAAARLMETFYQHLRAGESKAAALRAAQFDLMTTRPHPYYWAPFVLVGNR